MGNVWRVKSIGDSGLVEIDLLYRVDTIFFDALTAEVSELTEAEIETMIRDGTLRQFTDGDPLVVDEVTAARARKILRDLDPPKPKRPKK